MSEFFFFVFFYMCQSLPCIYNTCNLFHLKIERFLFLFFFDYRIMQTKAVVFERGNFFWDTVSLDVRRTDDESRNGMLNYESWDVMLNDESL